MGSPERHVVPPSDRVLRQTPQRAAAMDLFHTASESQLDHLQTLFPHSSELGYVTEESDSPLCMPLAEDRIEREEEQQQQEEEEANTDGNDPLDLDPTRLAAHILQWSLDPKHSKHVKQRDRDEVEFLNSMVKYERHFSPEDKKGLRKRLRFFYLVSDLNWNAAINDQREVKSDDFGIKISDRTASIRPLKRGRGGPRGRPRGGGQVGRGAGAAARGRGSNV